MNVPGSSESTWTPDTPHPINQVIVLFRLMVIFLTIFDQRESPVLGGSSLMTLHKEKENLKCHSRVKSLRIMPKRYLAWNLN